MALRDKSCGDFSHLCQKRFVLGVVTWDLLEFLIAGQGLARHEEGLNLDVTGASADLSLRLLAFS